MIDRATAWASFGIIVYITAIMVAILIIMLVVPPKTRMGRGWRSKVIAFNLILWQRWYLRITGEEQLAQPGQIIFLLIVAALLTDFAVAFWQVWITTFWWKFHTHVTHLRQRRAR